MSAPRFGLVLGGGGLRGLAHVGALRALADAGWEPDEIAGTSIGALVAAAWAAGFDLDEMEELALSMRRRDIFRIAHADMAFKRMHSPALYRIEPLDALVRGLLGEATFRDLPRRLIIGCVEINSGMQAFFGLPGLDDVRVADAIFASCALPGFFPPREIGGRYWVDGALVDNLPVRLMASRGHSAVVGVDVGASSILRADTQDAGFAGIFARATEIVFQQASEWHLRHWDRPPLLYVQPRVEHVPQFSFRHTRELIDEGARATRQALAQAGDAVTAGAIGIHPCRRMQLSVIAERCTGCGVCFSVAPAGALARGPDGKAVATTEPQVWSPVDGGFLRQCPTYAITARPLDPGRASTGGASRGTARETV